MLCCFIFVQEEDAEAERVKEERLKAYAEKKSKSKPGGSVMFSFYNNNNNEHPFKVIYPGTLLVQPRLNKTVFTLVKNGVM